MRTSGRSAPDRPGHGGTADGAEPVSMRTTPDPAAPHGPKRGVDAAFPAHMSSASERSAAGSRRSSCPISALPALARIWAAMSPAAGVVRPERKRLAPSGADALATAPPTEPGAPQATVALPSSCISGLLRGRAVRGLVRSLLRGAHSRPRLSSWLAGQKRGSVLVTMLHYLEVLRYPRDSLNPAASCR
jgi:hypothetical protein